ncbi:LCP family protein [Salipaludibacillus agaradhaerens]|uniref:LCP family glycopolymer transferase n=1 Tax=Salipaludibacillus agaradhaerens TaxID=76935 RepID=UPI002150D3D9|nr:LCP family protein [Salipaludibacillus agaradhaerens]MCR6108139.1 LCP family protein [Salipaludibacillus agaradhaerens]MCR6120164.1 LCP family protein [Salipaludibacillus agaradhaerens]
MKKIMIVLGSLFLVSLLAVGGYGFYLYKSVQTTVNSSMHTELNRDKPDLREFVVDMEEREPVSFLLLGVDAEESTSGRTDTMMVVTVNPDDESMRMVSIPRDTRMDIPGLGKQDKVNHAYAFGGPDMAIAAVENYLDIPIDYFLSVNMDGFQEMVDAVGGVNVQNELVFSQNGHEFNEGELFLNGDQALAYARMRKEDPRGDLGRNERQRQIVHGMIKEGAQLSSITRAQSILDALGNNIMTNLTFDNMVSIQQNYSSATRNQKTLELTGTGDMIDGVWYLIVPEEERLQVSGELRTHLGLESSETVALTEEDHEDEES